MRKHIDDHDGLWWHASRLHAARGYRATAHARRGKKVVSLRCGGGLMDGSSERLVRGPIAPKSVHLARRTAVERAASIA